MKKSLLFAAGFFLSCGAFAQVELLTNGSFETGALSPWAISSVNGTDGGPTSCVENWRVQTDSVDLCCCVNEVTPTDGSFAAFTSFDGGVADTEWILEQTVSIPATIVAADFSFDFTAEFDFGLGAPVTIPRELRIDIYTTGGTPFSNFYQEDYIGAATLSVVRSETIDVSGLLSGLEGLDAVIRITATIPEPGAGPGKTMIDNMSFIVDDGLSVEDQTLATAITVSPNPSNGVFTLAYSGNEVLTQATIFDITGKQIAVYNLNNLQGNFEINSNLPTGFYILNVQSENSQTTKKLIVR